MTPDRLSPTQHLRMALDYYEIPIERIEERMFYLANDYQVEVERGFLFKLLWRNEVVAPFNDLDEMCQFIKQA